MRLRGVLLFAALWPPIGFSLGTLTLLGPVRWITDATRAAGFSPLSERVIVLLIIVALIGASALLGLLASHRIMDARSRVSAWAIPSLVVFATAGALWAWFTPGLLNRGAAPEQLANSAFTFGPYPEGKLLQELADQGFTHVVSLLHPAVIPFEPMLLAEEREAVAAAGLELVHAPMLPWVGDNEESLERIRQLAEEGDGRYYVHCYLGRDRVGVVKRLVAAITGSHTVASGDEHPLAELERLERGPIVRVGPNTFLTPFPTDEEMLAFFLNERTHQVVSLLDPGVEANLPLMQREREALEAVGVPLIEIPLGDATTDEMLQAAARRIAELDGVTLVHRFRSTDPLSERLAALIQSAGAASGRGSPR